MPLKDLTSWTCDLCGEGETVKKGGSPDGWVKVSLDDKYEERCWHDKVVCSSCIKLIDEVREKLGIFRVSKKSVSKPSRGTGPVHLSGQSGVNYD